jgi:arylsulfatase A-like enzyme
MYGDNMKNTDRRRFLRILGWGSAAFAFLPAFCRRETEIPNVVIIFTDDQGYGDVGCYGARGYTTPNLDNMAREGVRFTDFYSASPGCSPSRAALLTGCYPQRVGIPGVLGPKSRHGLDPGEVTIADLLKSRGYRTACIGKWHLGDHASLLPWNHGFDEYLGIPYSNDMWPVNDDGTPAHSGKKSRYVPPPLYDGQEIAGRIMSQEHQNQLTVSYTQRAVRFIQDNRNTPFFLYLAHSMPHVPLGVSEKFQGRSAQGMYGDVMMEIDWSVGRILEELDRWNLGGRTLVIFTSDNGPWLPYGDHAGSTGGLREGKGTTFEGGMRVPCIMRWPERIPPGGICRELATTMDVLPTLAFLTGTSLPADRIIDGKNIWALMEGKKGAKSPHEAFFYHWPAQLQAVRQGNWKLHFPHSHRHQSGSPGNGGLRNGETHVEIPLSLYDLEKDMSETVNVTDLYPDVVEKLRKLAEIHVADLRDNSRRAARVEWMDP